MNNRLYNHGIGANNISTSIINKFDISVANDGAYLNAGKLSGNPHICSDGDYIYLFPTSNTSPNIVKYNIITDSQVWKCTLPSTVSNKTNKGVGIKKVEDRIYVYSTYQIYEVLDSDGSLSSTINLTDETEELKKVVFKAENNFVYWNNYIYSCEAVDRDTQHKIYKKDLNGNVITTYIVNDPDTFAKLPDTDYEKYSLYYNERYIFKLGDYIYVKAEYYKGRTSSSYDSYSKRYILTTKIQSVGFMKLTKDLEFIDFFTVPLVNNDSNVIGIYKNNIILSGTVFTDNSTTAMSPVDTLITFNKNSEVSCKSKSFIKDNKKIFTSNVNFWWIDSASKRIYFAMRVGTDSYGYQYQILIYNLVY